MNSPEPTGTNVDERRAAVRRKSQGTVSVRIDTTELEGSADNLSKTGILFFTDGELDVTVSVAGEDGTQQEFKGQLVRCERILGGRRGWAVEFDRAD